MKAAEAKDPMIEDQEQSRMEVLEVLKSWLRQGGEDSVNGWRSRSVGQP